LLRTELIDNGRFFGKVPSEKLDYKYAEGKWTVKEVLMHIIDTRESLVIEDLLPPGAIT